MRSRHFMHAVFGLLAGFILFNACGTDVELCYEDEHPHRGDVSFGFDWKNYVRSSDSMYVVARRVINSWKAMMVVSTAEPVRGHFLFDTTDSTSTLPAVTDVEYFSLRSGAYKFMAFSMDSTELRYSEIMGLMSHELSDNALDSMYVEYNIYSKDDPRLHHIIVNWQDYNPYAQYMQPDVHPVYFDTVSVKKVESGVRTTCVFEPKPITQNIDIYFNIKKDISKYPFVIDSVRADISGIPRRINIANAYLDIERTCKMMFHTELLTSSGETLENDQETNRIVRCHANIDVPSLVSSSSATLSTGPGIMQVIVYAHANTVDAATGEVTRKRKKIQGKINLYNTLRRAKLLTYTVDGKNALRNGTTGLLDIVANVTIDGDGIVENNDNTGGLDAWIACGSSIIIDI